MNDTEFVVTVRVRTGRLRASLALVRRETETLLAAALAADTQAVVTELTVTDVRESRHE
jgi:hypothetical protein